MRYNVQVIRENSWKGYECKDCTMSECGTFFVVQISDTEVKMIATKDIVEIEIKEITDADV